MTFTGIDDVASTGRGATATGDGTSGPSRTALRGRIRMLADSLRAERARASFDVMGRPDVDTRSALMGRPDAGDRVDLMGVPDGGNRSRILGRPDGGTGSPVMGWADGGRFDVWGARTELAAS
jgi:hypothetical protein